MKQKRINNCIYQIFPVLLIICLMLPVHLVDAQNLTREPEVTQIFRPIAEITDPASIETLLFEFLLAEDADEVERIEIIDITNNGFGPDDVLVVYPSTIVYTLDQPGPDVAEIMRGWSFEEQRRDGVNLSADYFYPAHADTLPPDQIEETQIELVQNALIADIKESLNRNYDAMPFSLRLERDNEGFTFQMWNYDRDAFSYTPRPPGTPDSVAVNDLMYVMYSDSTVIADTTYYDLIYLNQTIEDIVYLPGREPDVERFDRRSLPGQFNRSENIPMQRREN